MPYTDCLTWDDPTAARLEMTGPLLRDHPNVRALLVCADCGQTWLYDFLDSKDWGGKGAGRVIYAPVPDAARATACDALSAEEIETLRPRLVIHDHRARRIERVT